MRFLHLFTAPSRRAETATFFNPGYVERVRYSEYTPLFCNDQDRKCSRLHAALGTPARFGRGDLLIFGRRQKDILCLRIEGHRLRARLCLDRSRILVAVR